MITRRDFIKLTLSSALVTHVIGSQSWANDKLPPAFATAYKNMNGSYGVALLSEKGEVVEKYEMSTRGHGLCNHKDCIVIFARRPGKVAMALDVFEHKKPVLFAPPAGSHFYGHGVFSHDGQLIYTTENIYDEGVGIIGIYDATDQFKRVGSFFTHGTGPHDVALLPDGKTLCVANGGIRTHPETGRTKLNLSTMCSSVVFLDRLTGDLKAKLKVPQKYQRLSLRHLVASETGKVWLGGQYQGARSDEVPLVATANLEDGLIFPEVDMDVQRRMAHYIGSVSYNKEAGYIGFSSPKGGQMFILDVSTGNLIGYRETDQVCGLAARGGSFVESTMAGIFDGKKTPYMWDNHMISL